jgi:chemotaxis signal transduction protein
MASPTMHLDLPVSAPGTVAVLVGRIGHQRVALPAATVERILPMAALTPLADAPPGVAGLLDVRGEVLPVIDPRPRLDLPSPQLHPDQHLILISAGTRFLLWLDLAEELVQVPETTVHGVETLELQRLMSGVIRLAGETVPLLSPDALDPGTIVRRAVEAGT